MAKGQYRETPELIAATRRMLRAIGKRSASEDPIIVRQLLDLRRDVDQLVDQAVQAQRAAGMTWQSIADELGVTRQACIIRWGPSAR